MDRMLVFLNYTGANFVDGEISDLCRTLNTFTTKLHIHIATRNPTYSNKSVDSYSVVESQIGLSSVPIYLEKQFYSLSSFSTILYISGDYIGCWKWLSSGLKDFCENHYDVYGLTNRIDPKDTTIEFSDVFFICHPKFLFSDQYNLKQSQGKALLTVSKEDNYGTLEVPKDLNFGINLEFSEDLEVRPSRITSQGFTIVCKSILDRSHSQDIEFTPKNEINRAIRHIELESEDSFNTILLWLVNFTDLYRVRHLLEANYIVSSHSTSEKYYLSPKRNVGIFVHLYYDSSLYYVSKLLSDLGESGDVHIVVQNESQESFVSSRMPPTIRCRAKFYRPLPLGRDISSLLLVFAKEIPKYELFCFIHDKSSGPQGTAEVIGPSWMEEIWESLIGPKSRVKQVQEIFDKNPKLGFLSPNIPYHGPYAKILGRAWTSNYEDTKKLLIHNGINVRICKDDYIFSLSSCFWARFSAIKNVFDMRVASSDFCDEPMPKDGELGHRIERVFPYVAAYNGFFSGTLTTQELSDSRLLSYESLLRSLARQKSDTYAPTNPYQLINDNSHRIESLCLQAIEYHLIYIFGTGERANLLLDSLQAANVEVNGFIVTDAFFSKSEFRGKPIYALSDFLMMEKKALVIDTSAGQVAADKMSRVSNKASIKCITY